MKIGSKDGRLVKTTNRAVIELKELGLGAVSWGAFLKRGGEIDDFWTTWLNVAPLLRLLLDLHKLSFRVTSGNI